MSTAEYDIIDELYFVTGFAALAERLDLEEAELESYLKTLLDKGYIKSFFPDPDTEVTLSDEHLKADFKKCFFLATKAGLIAHNSI